MKFTRMIAIIAISGLAVNANAIGSARVIEVAQNEQVVAAEAPKEVTVNINTSAPAKVQQQPVTVVEAAPVTESKAEAMRKARQDVEIQTEQKIVERLEQERLTEEKARADRLFGPPAPAAAAAAAPVVTPAPAPAPVQAPAPVVAPAPVQQQQQVMPPTVATPVEPVEPVQTEKAVVVAAAVEDSAQDSAGPAPKYYAAGLLGNMGYQASNVQSNYSLGAAIGMVIDPKWTVELAYIFSNHYIDDATQGWALYHRLDQSDVSFSAKYYFGQNKIRPWVGGSGTYIYRKYTDLIRQSVLPYNNYSATQTTQAVNMGILSGADFSITETILLGAGIAYNFNVMTFNGFDQRSYNGGNLPGGIQELEKIDYWTMLVTAKFIF